MVEWRNGCSLIVIQNDVLDVIGPLNINSCRECSQTAFDDAELAGDMLRKA